jgi:hypothetical protein
MLLWMERMKRGLDVIKMTFGPEWMLIWLLNEYGRAVNARMHIEEVIAKHVAAKDEQIPVKRARGHSYHEPSTKPVPLLALRDNLLRDQEDIYGLHHLFQSKIHGNRKDAKEVKPQRSRANSAPCAFMGTSSSGESGEQDDDSSITGGAYVEPFEMEQDLARPKYESSPHRSARKKIPTAILESTNRPPSPLSPPRLSSPKDPLSRTLYEDIEDDLSLPDLETPQTANQEAGPRRVSWKLDEEIGGTLEPMSVLEQMLHQQGDGYGASQAVMTELSIILWMMLDVGNAWTAMALNLLSADGEACRLVQEEIDNLEMEHGRDGLFSPTALGEMKYLDALIWESIRLSPPFVGGLKVTSETVELPDAGVQVPKGSHIFFCQPTELKFDIHEALGKKPQNLGRQYPTVELFGFLPLRGLEVPLMVLQTKVFLVTALLSFTPCLTKKRTFIRRVRSAAVSVGQTLSTPVRLSRKNLMDSSGRSIRKGSRNTKPAPPGEGSLSGVVDLDIPPPPPPPPSSWSIASSGSGSVSKPMPASSSVTSASPPHSPRPLLVNRVPTTSTAQDLEGGCCATEMVPKEAMRLFTKIPFPEPRRIIHLRPRIYDE